MCGLQTTWAPASHCPAAVRVQTCPADAVWKSVLCNEPLTVAQGKTCMMFQKYPCWVIKTSTDQWMIQNHYNCNRNIRYHTTIYYIYNKRNRSCLYKPSSYYWVKSCCNVSACAVAACRGNLEVPGQKKLHRWINTFKKSEKSYEILWNCVIFCFLRLLLTSIR